MFCARVDKVDTTGDDTGARVVGLFVGEEVTGAMTGDEVVVVVVPREGPDVARGSLGTGSSVTIKDGAA